LFETQAVLSRTKAVSVMSRLDASGLFYTDLFSREKGLISLMLVSNPSAHHTLIDGMDRLVLAVCEEVADKRDLEHWMWGGTRILVRRVTKSRLENELGGGANTGLAQWLAYGDILLDRNGYLEKLRQSASRWPEAAKERRLLCEYSDFAKSYWLAKMSLSDGHFMDAYNHVLMSLQHWGNLVLIEEGMRPDSNVWEQVKRVNMGIYKLYEELTANEETLEQRVRLVMLACEFSLVTKMKTSCALLLRLLGSRPEGWSSAELAHHPELAGLPLDLELMLFKLVKRGYVREMTRSLRDHVSGLLEIRYVAERLN
jgi:hypothetical protein